MSEGMEEFQPAGLKTVTRRIASTGQTFVNSDTDSRNERSPIGKKRDDKTFKDYESEKTNDEQYASNLQRSDEANQADESEIDQASKPQKGIRASREVASIDESIEKTTNNTNANSSVGTPVNSSASPIPSVAPSPTKATGSVAPTRLECSANIGGGTYNTALNLALSCSTAATISYCIAEGTCCSPSTGSTYSSTINLGSSGTTYCMSFSGVDAFGNTSDIVEQTYTFNTLTPDIQVVHQKVWYQTTQLDGKLSLGSNDFGDSTIEGGVINFKNTDPVLAGYPTCAEQVEESAALTPVSIMSQASLAHLTSSMQLDVFYSNIKLIYGDNFITSYLMSTALVGAYSCNTTKIRLEDFPYFETNPTISQMTGSVLEFSGGFTPVSFFEAPAPTITRSPAGSSTVNEGGQELRSGLFGIFY